ncbi:MAG: short chain dehydrogenase [Prolixibacteraceae bacterium]|jgi:NAD(P)-dependent dehydrogenase (short-subunit alcohol dehydrogenase family)|nr:short chain dehydrogenase [Prolixibacteraceae bacterium]MBT6762931.1 short chain dehydrogenase [Prolixibacteraceae bacterium]MBT6996876.1 short chain dehydrogenase [Prolixibacteraceae bacterium]MBT7395966.1 short chain dehydrogenase [Prolixibacteraceae bacterium]
MKILVVGGNGTIGKTVVNRLKEKHEIIVAGRKSGDIQVDISDIDSIKNMYKETDKLDAVVCCAGAAKWAAFNEMTEDDFYIGIKSKMMGQVNLVRIGKDYLNDGGSITLTTGILAEDPVYMTTNAAMVNGSIHGFVTAVSQELKNGLRINVVAPGLVEDSAEKYADFFPGHSPVSMQKVANGFVRSIEGKRTGEIIRIYE